MKATRRNGLLVLAIAALAIAGACTNSYTKRFQEGPSDYSSKTGEDHELPNQRMLSAPNDIHARHHLNATLDIDHNTAGLINDLRGIRESYVAIAGTNAYVAIIIDNSGTGMKGKGTLQPSDRTIGQTTMNDVSDKAYRLKPGMVVMDKYSYNLIPNHDDISTELQVKIADIVRTVHPDVAYVHISANGEFINEMNRYAQMTWQGRSVSDQIASFNAMVSQYFP
ncbi:hypothetical protein ACFQWB_06105 [Paenibacillus thermoaerophilus]|uniref:Sporulation lipoprotein YhcN/YlaJ (Spore_YhcN_YlaJ) n=1 Tax=Paenibacillus thermoaerophilus TaxID=1215385 RepID=A0ABW2V5F9_9BACL|nr:hypothetical protein [Paenibacillus thermoaerophilus]TMV18221.1 hypothetical protein FE781_04550 [Paenibacillus thermoaerophilus]